MSTIYKTLVLYETGLPHSSFSIPPMSQPNALSHPYIVLSTESNFPLTAPLSKKNNQSPAERALQRFAITGNAIGQYAINALLLFC